MPERSRPLLPRRRVRRYLVLAATSALLFLAIFLALHYSADEWVDHPGRKAENMNWRASMALAYLALAFLAVTLTIGPINVLRGHPNPVNSYLRRDVAIWAGLLALGHMAAGMLVHTPGLAIWRNFLWKRPSSGDPLPIRRNLFGVANFIGLTQAAVIVLLLALSNDWALRALGSRRWKWLQRSSYVALFLIAGHGAAYHRVEQRTAPVPTIFWGIIIAVVLLQLAGFWQARRRQARRRKKRAPSRRRQVGG